MKILVAEDERITRRSLQRKLEHWGHEVLAVEDGAQAWDRFQQESFDIVVTDWDMPHVDGRELIQRIRGFGSSSYVYLIMLTGRSETADLVAGMEAGADDFLPKPFDRSELRVRLHAGQRVIQLERSLAARNQELSKANDRMKRDLEAAADVQRSLLPGIAPDTLSVRFAWHYEPCDELGGDIFNVLPLDDGCVAMYLLDVSGHGVPAALLSVTLSRFLATGSVRSSILLQGGNDGDAWTVQRPEQMACQLNQRFPMSSNNGRYFTITYAVLEPDSGLLRYVLAGHPSPILMRKGQSPEELAGGGLPVGMFEEAEYEEYSVQLSPGDRLYFYSDGITEARNEQGAMLDAEGLMQFVEEACKHPIQKSIASVLGKLRRWCGPVSLADDISLLAFELPD
jgi:sigma-B regulation protein RsbU (phosphoserine phosphatase)